MNILEQANDIVNKRSEEKEGDEVIHRGISQRSFRIWWSQREDYGVFEWSESATTSSVIQGVGTYSL